MRIFITGGGGFIGRALQEYLRAHYRYTLLAPTSAELDLTDEHALDSYVRLHKPDHIIHLANRGGGRDTLGLHDIAESNLRMFFAIAKQSARVERVITFGSGAEYSKHKPIINATEPSYLDALPLDSYGFYKNIASRFIEASASNLICLRIFGCYGAGENYRYKFISNAIVKSLLRLPITIYRDCVFDYIYIKDLLRIIDWAMHATPRHTIYNASSGKPILLSQLARLVTKQSGADIPIHTLHSERNNEYTSDNSRLLAELDMSLTPHEQAICEMFAYFQQVWESLDLDAVRADPYLESIGSIWQGEQTKAASSSQAISSIEATSSITAARLPESSPLDSGREAAKLGGGGQQLDTR